MERLKSAGATKIAVVGHSLGANAAIGYAARRNNLRGVVALAPGHLPDAWALRARTSGAIAEAKKLIAAGKGDVRMSFPDLAQGIPFQVRATPLVYVSMFDPDGPAVMPKNAAAMDEVPLLWIVGVAWLVFARRARAWQTLGFAFLVVLAVLVFAGGKPYYLAAGYSLVFAAGAGAVVGWTAGRARPLRPLLGALLGVERREVEADFLRARVQQRQHVAVASQLRRVTRELIVQERRAITALVRTGLPVDDPARALRVDEGAIDPQALHDAVDHGRERQLALPFRCCRIEQAPGHRAA